MRRFYRTQRKLGSRQWLAVLSGPVYWIISDGLGGTLRTIQPTVLISMPLLLQSRERLTLRIKSKSNLVIAGQRFVFLRNAYGRLEFAPTG